MRSYPHRSAARILLALTLLVGFIPLHAHAAAETAGTALVHTQSVTAEVSQPTPSIALDGTFRLNVSVAVAAPLEYLEVRVRLRSPSGKLVYQKTEVHSGLPAGSHVISYEHDMAELGLKQGRYPIEVRILATDVDPANVSSRLLVVDPETDALPVAVVVAPTGVPYVTMAGTFAGDPAADTRLRDDLAFLAQLANDGPPIALALPPILIEQLARVAAGYETTAGIVVPASDETPVRYARMLDSLRSAVETGTIELIDVPYGLPDLADLSSIGGSPDLDLHWRQTDTVSALTLLDTSGSGVAYLGEHLSAEGLVSAGERGAACVLAHEGSLRSPDAAATPGCYTVDGTDTKVLVVNDAAAAGALEGPDAFYDALFEQLDGGTVVVLLEVGPGSPHTTEDVRHVVDWLGDASWLRAREVGSLTQASDREPASIAKRSGEPDDVEYWNEIVAGRSAALAYARAAGPDDPDATAAVRALLAAESSLITSEGSRASGRTQGLARSAEALEYVTAQFALIRLEAEDVTLSGTNGELPLTLINDTGKQLNLTLLAASGTRQSTVGAQEIVAQPTQNFLTLPVDLGNALSDEIAISVRAGDMTIAEAAVGVRASYIDRLATILMVVAVLAVLLVIIRRKVGSPVADTMLEDSHDTPRASRDK
ncbi:MAG: hypothetical protein WBJ62_03125 [Coriobacteriia bacterium]